MKTMATTTIMATRAPLGLFTCIQIEHTCTECNIDEDVTLKVLIARAESGQQGTAS